VASLPQSPSAHEQQQQQRRRRRRRQQQQLGGTARQLGSSRSCIAAGIITSCSSTRSIPRRFWFQLKQDPGMESVALGPRKYSTLLQFLMSPRRPAASTVPHSHSHMSQPSSWFPQPPGVQLFPLCERNVPCRHTQDQLDDDLTRLTSDTFCNREAPPVLSPCRRARYVTARATHQVRQRDRSARLRRVYNTTIVYDASQHLYRCIHTVPCCNAKRSALCYPIPLGHLKPGA
jgi:hypothetical protein